MVSDYDQECPMQSLLEQAISLFGWQSVSTALRRKTDARRYSLQYPSIVSDACKTFVSKMGNEAEVAAFISSLDDDLRDCVINNLVGNIGSNILKEFGLECN